jgi:inner membrane transporter RhtA
MVVGAIVSVQVGGAFAATVFDQVGAAGMVFLRLFWAAVILCAYSRPRLRGRTRHDWVVMAAFGALTATLCLTGYAAVDRLPLGLVVTLQLLGPLGLAVAMSHRAREFVWTAVAVAGVIMLGRSSGHIDMVGVALSLTGAAAWVGYILLSASTGRRFPGVTGLALALAVAALLVAPVGIAQGGTALLRPTVLLIGIVVALMTAVINFALELVALRQMPPRTFGVLMSLSPAVAALAGFVVLDQRLSLLQVTGIALVIAASAATVSGSRSSAEPAIVPADR